MRVLLCLVCLLLAGLTGPVQAGPWPRGKGHWFSATSSTWIWTDLGAGYSSGLYAEYGLTETLTLGLDGSLTDGVISGVFFTRFPIWSSDAGHRLALELGGGMAAGGPVMRPGISYGRGLETRWGGGWMTVDAWALVDVASGAVGYKMDSTMGLSPNERWKLTLQLQTARPAGGQFTAQVAPSVVRRLGDHFWIEAGASHALTGPAQSGVKLGIWMDF